MNHLANNRQSPLEVDDSRYLRDIQASCALQFKDFGLVEGYVISYKIMIFIRARLR